MRALEYACQAFHSSLPVYLSEQVERIIQKRALRILCPGETYEAALNITGLETLFDRRKNLSVELFQNISNNNQHNFLIYYRNCLQMNLILDVMLGIKYQQ